MEHERKTDMPSWELQLTTLCGPKNHACKKEFLHRLFSPSTQGAVKPVVTLHNRACLWAAVVQRVWREPLHVSLLLLNKHGYLGLWPWSSGLHSSAHKFIPKQVWKIATLVFELWRTISKRCVQSVLYSLRICLGTDYVHLVSKNPFSGTGATWIYFHILKL